MSTNKQYQIYMKHEAEGMKVYTVGYAASGSMARVQQLLTDKDTVLVDIRLRPQSRYRPMWNKKALISQFGEQYIHLPELGNLNYKDRKKDIHLADPDTGIALLVEMLSQGKSLILLCACKEYAHCHRRLVVELLKERMPEVEIMLEKELVQ